MTEILKCPFCGYKLNESYDSDENIVGYFCANPHCRIKADVLEPYVWRALIDGKKAQDAIQKIKDIVYPALDKEFYSELRDDMLDISRIIVSVAKQEV